MAARKGSPFSRRAGILDSGLDVAQRPADALETLLHQACGRVVVFAAESDGGFGLAVVDIVADIVDEIVVDLGCASDLDKLFAEDVNRDDGKEQEDCHKPSALHCHVNERIRHLLRNR